MQQMALKSQFKTSHKLKLVNFEISFCLIKKSMLINKLLVVRILSNRKCLLGGFFKILLVLFFVIVERGMGNREEGVSFI